jgi:hypothetical protein
MESTEDTQHDPAELTFETSAGPVQVMVMSRDGVAVRTASTGYPLIYLELERQGDRWELESDPPLYFDEHGKKMVAPAALVEELVPIGRSWADAHPEEFEREGVEEFDHLIGYIVNNSFDPVIEKLEEAKEDLSEALKNPEFVRQASASLRERVQDAMKMIHAMKLQCDAASEAIDDAYGESDEGE